MANIEKSKLRLLHLRRLLEEETDEERGITMSQILDRLEDFGVDAERKSIYRDIAALRAAGDEIKTLPKRPVEYVLVKRGPGLSELMLLADAAQSSKFLTGGQADMLVRNLKQLASVRQRKQLERQIHVAGRIRSKNDSVFGFIDAIHAAMHKRRQISFLYYHLGADGKRYAAHGGASHVVTPVAISYSNGFYYLTAWSEEHESMREFRIDRMGALQVTENRAAQNSQISAYEFEDAAHEYFGRFDGPVVNVVFDVAADKVEIILDRFGEHAEFGERAGDRVQARARIRKSQQFFGWVAGLNGTVRIAKPASLVREYKEYLAKLIEEV